MTSSLGQEGPCVSRAAWAKRGPEFRRAAWAMTGPQLFDEPLWAKRGPEFRRAAWAKRCLEFREQPGADGHQVSQRRHVPRRLFIFLFDEQLLPRGGSGFDEQLGPSGALRGPQFRLAGFANRGHQV